MSLSAPPSSTVPSFAWAKALSQPATEFAATPLQSLTGQIPPGLQGTLYRNGPARLQRGGLAVGHWFDGDGAILRVQFAAGEAAATYRYVQSAGFQDEEAADQYLYRGYGTMAPGSLWQRWRAQIKNAANTSVLALPDRLLALWEGGLPHGLDLETLETKGIDALGGLRPSDSFSAHPKRHPRTGEIFSIGVIAGGKPVLQIYRCDPSGHVKDTKRIDLNGIPLIHDFALADRYLVFCVSPVRLNPLPAVFSLQTFSEALQWQPKWGTQIIVVEAESLEVLAWEQAEPWYQWHFGHSALNGDDTIGLDLVRYADFATNQQLKEVAAGQILTPAEAQLWHYRIDPHSGKILEHHCAVDRHCEFPVAHVPSEGPALTYLSAHRTLPTPKGDFFDAVAQFNPQTQETTLAEAGPGYYPSEAIPVTDRHDAHQHWVVTVVYNSHDHRSEVWIYDGNAFGTEPVARLRLPEVIPHSFHGTWR
jgi:all-trans-8'-apo-beta-carotenal 15,15'-oxygenase